MCAKNSSKTDQNVSYYIFNNQHLLIINKVCALLTALAPNCLFITFAIIIYT